MTASLTPTSHARLSASSAHRWINCPGSIEAEAGLPDGSTKYADEGTAAHHYAAVCLTFGGDAEALRGMMASPEWPTTDLAAELPPECKDWPLTADMAEHVQTYVDYVRGLWAFCDERWIESKSMVPELLAKLPEDVGGTSDGGGIDYAARTLHITDLKFGRGVLVEVENNEQFLIYALGKYGELEHDNKMRLAYVEMHVIQPRADHPDGPIRSWRISIVDLLNWARNVLSPAAFAALRPGAPRTAGDHCRFCKARGTCDEYRNRALESMPFTIEDMRGTAVVPALPSQVPMEPERVAEIYHALDRFEEWASAFRAFVFAAKMEGIDIPGVGLKRKRTNRKWLDEDMVAEFYDNAPAIFAKPAVLSVAQMEKLAKKHGMEFPAHLVTKDEGELTLCAATDKDALLAPPTAASHFSVEEL